MNINRVTGLGFAAIVLLTWTPRGEAGDESEVKDYAYISVEGGGFLTVNGTKVTFRSAKPRDRTKWNIWKTEDGFRIGPMYRGKLLGIDAKTKELALFDKPGPTTTWQAKSANAREIKLPSDFDALLFMKVGDEELRLSSGDMGTPVLGGKADILHIYLDGP